MWVKRCLCASSIRKWIRNSPSHLFQRFICDRHFFFSFSSAYWGFVVLFLFSFFSVFFFIYFVRRINREIIGTLFKAAYTNTEKPYKKNAIEEYTAILVRWKCDWNKRETNHTKENEINRAISIVADNKLLKWVYVDGRRRDTSIVWW